MDYAPEQKLFIKVMEQAIRDMTSTSTSFERIQDRIRAKRWFYEACPEFRKVCEYAGLDPDAVRERYIAGKIDRGMIERMA